MPDRLRNPVSTQPHEAGSIGVRRFAVVFALALSLIILFSQHTKVSTNTKLGLQPQRSARPQSDGWTQQTSGTSNNLFSVHFVNANEGWAVGFSNTILHTTNGGTTWTAQTNQGSVPVSSYLGVRFLDSNTGWAGGGSAVVRTTDGGTSWVSQGATQDGRFRNNLFAVSSNAAWIPAQNATSTIRWFSRFTVGVGEENFNVIGSSAQYADIYFTDADNGWSVGSGPIVRITNGSSASPSFSFQTTCPCPTLNGIHMLNSSTGWAVGNSGLILKTTNGGSTWNSQTSNTTTNLRSIHFANANQGWAVGAGGLILMSTDGGTSWAPETSGVSTELRRVFFVNANTGYAVGASGTILKRSVCVAPSIDMQPGNQAVCAGSSASFSVQASGTDLTYQWRKGTTPLSNGGNISGANTATLTINPTSASDVGSYDVVITGACGSVTSNPASLTVTTITLAPETLPNGILNSSYNQTITASGGTPPYTFAVTSGALPTGLSLSSGGVLSGTPTVNGTFNFTVTATDGTCSGSRNYTLVIDRGWTLTPNMSVARRFQTMTLLQDGKVLAAGGDGSSAILNSAELYDPNTGNWTATNSMSAARSEHTATLLPNGKVLVVGGQPSLTGAELYDPATGSWSTTGSLNQCRYSHTATLLSDGRVLVTGGFVSGSSLASAEIYNPATGVWTGAGNMSTTRSSHTATLLANGKVLVAGGFVNRSSADLYDPSTGIWSSTGSMNESRYAHTATLLANGKVLVAGGGFGVSGVRASAELYDPAGNAGAGSWSSTGSLNTARRSHTATLLPSGKVLITSGFDNSNTNYTSTELFDPAAGLGSWSYSSNMNTPRAEAVATLLPSGRVLVAGGSDSSFGPLASAEFFNTSAGSWSATGGMGRLRGSHTATLLTNGKVLIAGGVNNGAILVTELYDPTTGLFSDTGSLTTNRIRHTATLLMNGKVLVAGGIAFGNTETSSAELYDPSTGIWTSAGNMSTARFSHTATLLQDGRVLIAGGETFSGGYSSSVEIFDPAGNGGAGSWSAGPSMNAANANHTATLLPDGRVLVYGLGSAGSRADIYDPAAGQWSLTPFTFDERHAQSATLLPNGKVLLAGGNANVSLSSAVLFDPATGMVTPTGSMNLARNPNREVVLLPDGRVLVAGGLNASTGATFPNVDLYDPATGSWSETVPMGAQRGGLNTVTLLPNGKVLVAGGGNENGYLSSAELYDVGLNFNSGWRPTLASVTSPLTLATSLAASGSQFRGISEASGGGFQNSSTNYPLVQIRSLVNEQSLFVFSDPATNWSNTSFTSRPLPGLPPGYALVTLFTNGIPSESKFSLINCSFAVSPFLQSFSNSGGNGLVNVLTSSGCPWTAVSNSGFITVNSGASGSGSGSVNYSVAANTGSPRSGTMTVAGHTVTINQASGCIFSLDHTEMNFPAEGGTDSVTVTASNANCEWTATTDYDFITITSGSSGAGNGTVQFTVALNHNNVRVGTLTIAGITFNVMQANCVPPVIDGQPSDQAVCVGGMATFTVSTIGTAPTYQWRKNSIPIMGATGSSYTIASVSANDAASYDVVVSAACDSPRTSRAASLTVNSPPSIAADPVSLTRCAGDSATFSVTASGAGLSYQWRKNTSPISGATSSSYTIASVSINDAASYDVVVSGACNPPATSMAATLTVNSRPACSIDGPGQACPSANNTYTGPFGGNLTYSWSISGDGTIAGSTTSPLVTVDTASSGSFTLTLTVTDTTNNCSSTCMKTVPIAPPTPCSITGADSVCAGSTGNNYTGPSGSLFSYVWFISGNGSITGGNIGQSVTVNAGSAGSFMLTLNVTNADGCNSACNKTVIVNGSPVLTLDRDHQSFAGSGGNGAIAVTASDAICPWSATTTSSFITINSGSPGTGNGTVQYSVAPNSGSSIRNGTITVGNQTFTVYQGIDFVDVPPSHDFYTEIGKLAARGVTLGCNPNGPMYCPSNPVLREQMAAFLMRALGEFNPPPPAMQRFGDVPPSNDFYAFIERLAELGITLGCQPGNPPLYCPTQPVKREQMSAFILRALGEFNPPMPASQRFGDVPPSNDFYNFIDRLAVLQITQGCQPGNPPLFCPNDNVTRGQMAAFLVRAFDL